MFPSPFSNFEACGIKKSKYDFTKSEANKIANTVMFVKERDQQLLMNVLRFGIYINFIILFLLKFPRCVAIFLKSQVDPSNLKIPNSGSTECKQIRQPIREGRYCWFLAQK